MKVQSAVRPNSIGSDEYHVYINTNITETERDGITMYEYDQKQYAKDEYIAYLNEQLTNTQLALVEIYEGVMQNG